MANIEFVNIAEDNSTIYEMDYRLRFEDGRLYITQTPYKGEKQCDFPEKIDVTEDVLDMFLRLMIKKRGEKYQAAMLRELKGE